MPHAVNANGIPARFSVMDTTEIKMRAFDFTNSLTQPGEALLGVPAWSITVIDGLDPAPNNRLLGNSSVSGNVTSQMIGGCLAEVEYMLAATVNTTAGQKLTLWAEQYCILAL